MKRSFFQYVSLNVLGALGLSGYILADTLFVAHRLGTDGLAALNLAISVFGLINGLGPVSYTHLGQPHRPPHLRRRAEPDPASALRQ